MRNDEARPRKRRRPPTRRKTVRWSAGEVEALLAGVRAHGVGKWATILRHSKVFNGVRTSVDLKDKWRNLTSPVRAAALAARDPTADHGAEANAQSSAIDHDGANPLPASREGSPLPSPAASPHASPNHSSPVRSQSDLRSPVPSPVPLHTTDDQTQPIQAPSNPQSPVPSHSQSNPHSPLQSNPPDPPKEEVPPIAATLPPPFSESSVSPELLSTPSSQPPLISNCANATSQFSIPIAPPYSTQASSNAFQNVLNPHMAMQSVVNQRLYQSAAAIATYWRRMGHDPNPYSIAAALTASGGSSHFNPYYAMNGANAFCGAQDDDDDDDDDDEEDEEDDDDDEQTGLNTYTFGIQGLYGKNATNVPFTPTFANSFSPVSPAWSILMAGNVPVGGSSPNIAPRAAPQPIMSSVKVEPDRIATGDDGGPSASDHIMTGVRETSVVSYENAANDANQPSGGSEASNAGLDESEMGNGKVKTECELEAREGCTDGNEGEMAELGGASDMEYMSVNGFQLKTEKDSNQGETSNMVNLGLCDLDIVSTEFAPQEGDQQVPSITDL